ncbi:glycosyltransferase family 87 protein [Pontibacter silvestris]|uniref:Glycosyltransferase family 87 protein n=1 Tax=Pontibacter silvestris TaxID=2305183 RepID=A0ABW4WTL0_9BACT|nr:glycosyltransferase family 87 protein [Pontibacter silvestris]MCC9137698.1 DUF2029 domain-containing protein [Pontibacter silvestris]
MNKLIAKPDNVKWFILFGILICLTIFIVENINDRLKLNDFKVYYSAAEALTQGKQVYGLPFGLSTGFYKYSPFTLLLFVPYTIVSFDVARVIHFFLLSVCTISAIILLYRIVNNYLFEVKGKSGLLCLILICILNHLFRELHLGNINVILVLLVSMGVLFTLKSRFFLAGFLFALVIVTKPYFLLLMLPLVAYRKVGPLLGLAFSVFVFILTPAFFLGIDKNLQLHQDWVKSMLDHSSYLTSYNTIEYLIQYYLYPVKQGSIQNYVIALAGILYVLFFWGSNKMASRSTKPTHYKERTFLISVFILMAVVPNLVVTDTEHFLLSLPLIVILAGFLSTRKNYILTAGFVVLIFLYEGNSSDLLGKKLANQFDQWGVLGLSNLVLIAAVIYLYFKEGPKWKSIALNDTSANNIT